MEELLGLYLLAKFKNEKTENIMNCIDSLIEIAECDATYVTEFFCTCVKKPLECFPILFRRWDKIGNERLKEELLNILKSFPGIEIIYENKDKKSEL